MPEYKVLFHIDEINKWNLLLNNVRNLIDAGENNKLNIEVIANSEAVAGYSINPGTDSINNLMRNLKMRGVQFAACNNALRSFNINKDSLLDFVNVVPAGVLEIVIKQSEGYLYIKP